MEPIRVLRVVATLNKAGLETIIMNAYRLVDRTKIQFDFIMHTEEECYYCDEIRSLGGRIYTIPKFNGKNYLEYKKKWEDFFRNHREYKVIHGHVMATASIYLKIARQYGLYTISHSHSVRPNNLLSASIRELLQLPLKKSNYVDYRLACSREAGKYLFGESIEQNNFRVIKNGIDVKKFKYDSSLRDKMKKELGIEDKLIIGHVGRFNKVKNHEFLIEVFEKIILKRKDAILMLIGEGELRHQIEQLVRQRKIENKVMFLGIRDNINEIMQVMDVFIFPSFREGFGNVIIEAQSAGLPCLISDTVTKEVVVTNLIKFISLTEASEIWAEKAIEMANYQRRETTEEVIKAGFDVTQTANWYEEFYRNCYAIKCNDRG